jgi:hypothetical protein
MRPTDSIQTLTILRAQRNATESPLLRLPPEIRKKIWTFAVQVDCVQAPIIYCWETRRHQFNKGGAVAVQDNGAIATRHLETDTDNCCPFRQLGAFHLPEVCRQVYIETATLSYSTNIFLVGSESLLCKNWARKEILLAQRDAITKVELGFEILTRHYFSTYVWPASLRRRGFRNLTHVYISCHTRKVSVKKWRRHLYLWELHLKGSKELLTWCEAKLREKEGSDLVVVFEGYSFSGKHDDITPSGDDDDSDELSEESEDDDEGDDDE